MGLNFPTTPSVGQIYDSYKWDGEKWITNTSEYTMTAPLSVTIDHISETGLKLKNTNVGGVAAYVTQNDASGYNEFGVRGSARAAYGVLGPNDAYFYAGVGSANMVFMADHASGTIKWTTGGNTERMKLNSSGQLGIGTNTTATSLLTVNGNAAAAFAPAGGTVSHLVNNDGNLTQLCIDTYGNGGLANLGVIGRKAQGTLAAPSSAIANDPLLRLAGAGWTGSAFSAAAAAIRLMAAETFTASATGTFVNVTVCALGSATPADALRIWPSTGLSVGTAAIALGDPGAGGLRVGGDIITNNGQKIYPNIPPDSRAGAYTCVLGDAGRCMLGIGTWTIPANASVAYPLGTVLTFCAYGGSSTVACTDTVYWNNNGTITTGTRTISNTGIATAIKVTATTWVISGSGMT